MKVLDSTTFKKISQAFGDDWEMQISTFRGKEHIILRFGTWEKIDLKKLNDILPRYTQAVAEIDDDSERGDLWSYTLTDL